jgi:hypothetical protein
MYFDRYISAHNLPAQNTDTNSAHSHGAVCLRKSRNGCEAYCNQCNLNYCIMALWT